MGIPMPQRAVQPPLLGLWWILSLGVVSLMSVGARIAPWPALATPSAYAREAILLIGVAIYAIHGTRRRRGVWTAKSWRRFAASIAVSFICVASIFIFAAGVDVKASWVGPGRSATRGILIFTATATAITGIVMFVGAMHRFASEPSDSQYDSRLARWLRGA
jgi:hypothetical protein